LKVSRIGWDSAQVDAEQHGQLASVVSGHLGWVRCCAFEPANEWFVTGGADRTIKVWDLAKCGAGAEGGLKLTLTGHINAIRGLAVSPRTTYMFSAGEDKKVMCWDLEMNKVVRHYHGHLSGVYSLAIHPTLDLLMTGGRDSCVRVWDVEARAESQPIRDTFNVSAPERMVQGLSLPGVETSRETSGSLGTGRGPRETARNGTGIDETGGDL